MYSYFILSDAIVSEIVFLASISYCLLLVCRNILIFVYWSCILQLTLFILIFLVDSLGFYTYKTISSTNRDSFTFFPLFSWLYKYHRELLLHFILLYCGCLGCEPVAAGRAPSFLLRAFWWSFRWGVSDITDAAYLVNSSVPFANCISGQLFH